MELIDFVVIGIIAVIIGGALAYIIRYKRRGAKCIGCPYAKSCGARPCCSAKASCSDKKPDTVSGKSDK